MGNGPRDQAKGCPSGSVRGQARRLVLPILLKVKKRLLKLLLQRKKKRKKKKRKKKRRKSKQSSPVLPFEASDSNIPDRLVRFPELRARSSFEASSRVNGCA